MSRVKELNNFKRAAVEAWPNVPPRAEVERVALLAGKDRYDEARNQIVVVLVLRALGCGVFSIPG